MNEINTIVSLLSSSRGSTSKIAQKLHFVFAQNISLLQFNPFSNSYNEKILLISVGTGALFSYQLHQSYM